MALFRYSALSVAGEPLAGEIEADNRSAVIAHLQNLGHFPIEAGELSRPKFRLFNFISSRQRASTRDLGLIAHQLARLLRAGLPLDRSLQIVADLAEKKSMKTALIKVDERLRNGASLADALLAQKGFFPESYVSTVRAGEAGGSLAPVLGRLGDFVLRSEAVRQHIISALIYPAILLVVAGISITIVLTVVLPQFKPVFAQAGASLPIATRMLVAAGDFVGHDWPAILTSIVAIALGAAQIHKFPDLAYRRDRLLIGAPLIGDLVTKFNLARFGRTLGTLLSNGVILGPALAIAGDTFNNLVLKGAIGQIATGLREGEGLSEPLAKTGLFPTLATQMMRIGEETGRFDEMLLEIADIYDQEVQRSVDRMLALLVPALTIFMGFIVAFIVMAILLAMLSVNDLAR
jgi:general secretion pathway protein F